MKRGFKVADSIIFDLDGTLWDGTDGAAIIWREEAAKYPEVTDSITADKLKALYGLPLEEIAVKLLTTASRETAIAIMRESVVKQCPYLEEHGGILFPNLEATLQELKKKYKLYIVSNCEEGYIQCFLKAHNLEEYFLDYEYPGRTRLSKAENIKLIMERNQLVNPVYVGDTAGDEKASRLAGIPFVYAAYGFGKAESYDYVINAFEELTKMKF